MIPLPHHYVNNDRHRTFAPHYVPMMTRHCPRRDISRTPHSPSPKRPSIRNNSLYYFRSFLFLRIFLSFLPLKSCPYTRTRGLLTTHRPSHIRPIRSTFTKHCRFISLRCNRHMSPPQHYGGRTKTSNPITSPDNSTRLLLHFPPRNGILRSPFYNCRRSLRVHLLRRHRVPWSSRHHWFFFPSCLPHSTNPVSFYLRTSFWV